MRPIKPFFKAGWRGARLCTRGAIAMAHWSIWLVLALTLGVQLYVLTAQQLTLPRFVMRELTTRLASSGFRAEFGRTQFDPLGRILLENVRLIPVSVGEPVLTVRSVYLQLDPWMLLLKDVNLTEAELIGVDLLVPAMFSPTGTGSTLVKDLNALLRLRPERRELELIGMNGRIGPLTVTVNGAVSLAAAGGPRPDLAQLGPRYLRFAQTAAPWIARLDALTDPQLTLTLAPDAAAIARIDAYFTATHAAVPSDFAALPGDLTAKTVELRTAFAARSSGPVPLDLTLSLADVAIEGQARAHRVVARVTGSADRGPLRFVPATIEVAANQIEARGMALAPVKLRLESMIDDGVGFEATGVLTGETWTAAGLLDRTSGRGTVAARGRVPQRLLAQVGAQAGIALVNQVEYAGAPWIEAVARLGAGGRPEAVEGAFVAGPVTARNVPLEGARARFAWAGSRLAVSDILLRTPHSTARGSYEMDTDSRAFRFLLEGNLQPDDINGWFREWWSRFWTNFDFSGSTPRAGVEVAGRWGAPLETTVFVGAEGETTGLRGVTLDRVRTRLFIRPGFVDAIEFKAGIGERSAQGRFMRIAEPGTGRLRELEFAITSDLALADASRLAGPAVVRAVAPFDFEQAPQMTVSGRIEGPGSPVGEHQQISISARSQGEAAFYGFPLRNLSFTGRVDDDDILIEDVAAVFAGGDLRGHARLQALGGAQRLGFDAVLTGAELGRSIQTVEDYSAARAGRTPSPQSRFQQKIAPGKLDLALSAEGTARDIYSFQGTGNAQISGADLGEINLLGILSSLLRRTLLNFSTLQLDAARANFSLQGRKLAFTEIKLTGPRAALDAQGDYYLDTKSVDFTTKVHPFEESRGLIGSAVGAVLAPFSQVLEVKLTGKLADPDWAFVLGPTNLLRSLLGTEPDASQPAPAISPESVVSPPGG